MNCINKLSKHFSESILELETPQKCFPPHKREPVECDCASCQFFSDELSQVEIDLFFSNMIAEEHSIRSLDGKAFIHHFRTREEVSAFAGMIMSGDANVIKEFLQNRIFAYDGGFFFRKKENIGYMQEDRLKEIIDELTLIFRYQTDYDFVSQIVARNWDSSLITDLYFNEFDGNGVSATMAGSGYFNFDALFFSKDFNFEDYGAFTIMQKKFLEILQFYARMQKKYRRKNYFYCPSCSDAIIEVKPFTEILTCEKCGSEHPSEVWGRLIFSRYHFDHPDIDGELLYISEPEWSNHRIVSYKYFRHCEALKFAREQKRSDKK